MLDVLLHRLRYSLSPQTDLYTNIAAWADKRGGVHTALDVGCGTAIGSLMLLRANRTVVATDIDPQMVVWAQEMWGHLLLVSHETIEQTVAHRVRYDLVTCIEVIEHVPNPTALLTGLKACVAPGGALVLSTLNHNSQYRKNNLHVAPFAVDSFRRLVTQVCGPALLVDFQLETPLADDSGITPMVAVWTYDAHAV
jgi:2-polyprenyl-3-methyl-5-hydroxy-6-metoxy-1,4-benzoquinol methylase